MRPRRLAAAKRRAPFVAACVLIACVAGGVAFGFARGPAALVVGDGRNGPPGMVLIPGAAFLMGTDSRIALQNERPAHRVRLHGYWIDRHDVTNAEFRAFVAATGYVTTAERKPRWDDLKTQLPPGTPRPPDDRLVAGAMVFVGSDAPVSLVDYGRWWRFVPGANWRHPSGPGSDIAGKDDHPVVQVSYEDALAYASWKGKRLPTEAEWEYAARGGLEQKDYAWGDVREPGGRRMANVWDDRRQRFPVVADAKIRIGTSPVCQYPPNGYGLCDMAGNVWQWTADRYREDYFALQAARGETAIDPAGPSSSFDTSEPGVPADAPRHVTRGGSFLCSEAYCTSDRTSARRGLDPASSMPHVGFRLAMSATG
ncbi:SUMF1/EgtB/PvdO family nonheme iron enzyme [Burkholderia sp. 4701]|nr:SUMF1/EgtB/PvdO family nonheme iron enzyme [Burkholderia sp. 4701]MXN81968.1 SUMF1/EgtB/PvdO family nonheme iron enzyme [Burkholderia sp. 4812]